MFAEFEGVILRAEVDCPFCEKKAYKNTDPRSLASLYICATCGKFCVDEFVEVFLNSLSKVLHEKIYMLSFSLRAVSELAHGKRNNAYFPAYSSEDLQRMLEAPVPTVQEKLSLLLRFLGRLTEFPGQVQGFDYSNDWSVIAARNPEEAIFYFKALNEQGLLRAENVTLSDRTRPYTLTANGWKELQRQDDIGLLSRNGFIAMSFHPDRQSYGQAISAAITAAGYDPIRVDKVEHVNRIDDEIIAQIRRSRFVVADFTQQRNGVYFEAGFMLGLGRTVIWLCEKNDLSNVHFDTRQYNTIDYTDTEDLQKRLQLRIEAILGKGPHTSSR